MSFEYGIRSFETGEFKVTKPNDFNDPYDCYGFVKGDFKDKVFWEYIDKGFERIRNEYGGSRCAPREVFESKKAMGEWMRPTFAKKIHEDALYRRMFDQETRLLCFVGKEGLSPEADALMWSHYADCGKGVRIELEIPEEKGMPFALRKMTYSDTTPSLDLSEVEHWPECPQYDAFFTDCLWTKGRCWEYENEVRMVCSPHYPIKIVKPVECSDGVTRDFVHFQASDIKGLIFGPKVHPEVWISYYAQFCKKHPQSEIVFERALLETDRYAYGYENLEVSMCRVFKEFVSMKTGHHD